MRLRTSVFPASWDAQQKAGDVANVVEEDVTGVRVVKGFGQERRELDRLADAVASACSRPRCGSSNMQARLQPAMQTIPAFGQVAVLALGGWLAIEGNISLGTFLAFSTYMLMLTPPVRQLAAILTVGQLARAGAERIFDLLDSTPRRAGRSPTPTHLDGAARRGALRRRDVRLHVDRAGAPRLLAHGRRRARPSRSSARRGRGSRRSGLLLPRFYDVQHGSVTDRRHRRARRHAAVAAPRRSASCSRTRSCSPTPISANIAFGAAGRDAARGRSRGARCGSPRVHPAASVRLRHGRRRAGPHALGRPTPAHRPRARAALGPAHPAARRRDLVGRRAHRGGDPRDAAARRCRSHDDPDRAPPLDACRSPTASSSSTRAGRRHRHARRAAGQRCSLYRMLLSGPGDDAEGIDAHERRRSARRPAPRLPGRGITPAAWRGLDARRAPQRTDRRPHAGWRRRCGWRRRRRWRRRELVGGMGGALAPTPELLAQVDALPPADRDPEVDVAIESRPRPDFRFFRFLGRYRRGLVARARARRRRRDAARSRGRCSCGYGIDRGVVDQSTQALWAAVVRVPRRHALRLVGDVGATRASWAAPRSGCCTRCASRCSRNCSGSASTTTSTRWRAGS